MSTANPELSFLPEAADHPCHVCGSPELKRIRGYEWFHRVTSDCKPWRPGGQLAVCAACGCIQAVIDSTWRAEADEIYGDYAIYHTSNGVEQSVYDRVTGQAASRSARLLQRVTAEHPLPSTGRLLDIGCGNGALLRAFASVAPGWSLYGLEVNDRYRSEVEAIRGVEGLFTGSFESVPGRFHLISLMHALEHIPSPRDFIVSLFDKLEPGGILLIQVPDCECNAFMFLVADHASHFFRPTLCELGASAGYEVLASANDWIAKELTVLLRKSSSQACARPMRAVTAPLSHALQRTVWLADVVNATRTLMSEGKAGLFGTSIAANWLFGELAGNVSFFVDEDPHRAGKSCCGRPIYHPNNVPAGSKVFIALPWGLAQPLRARLESQRQDVEYHVPPPVGK